MSNYVLIFGIGTAIAEVVIENTKDGVEKKGLDKGLYATIVYAVCGVIGCLYDIFMLGTQFNIAYLICAIFLIGAYTIMIQLGYDKCKALDIFGKCVEATKRIFNK